MKLSERVEQAQQESSNVIDLTVTGVQRLETDDPLADFKSRVQEGLHRKLGLRLAGVDCILEGETPYIIEVNSKPMLAGYYRQCPDQQPRVEAAYREIVKALMLT